MATRPPYPRISAPVLQRSATRFWQGLPDSGAIQGNVGLRTFSDEAMSPGAILEIEAFPREGSPITAVVRIEWCDGLPEDGPARYDVGLRVLRIDMADLVRLEGAMRPRTEVHAPATARELRETLARILRARDDFMTAVRSSLDGDGAFPEEDRYLAALHAARLTLDMTE